MTLGKVSIEPGPPILTVRNGFRIRQMAGDGRPLVGRWQVGGQVVSEFDIRADGRLE
jgi:hypothetical protein